MTCKDVAPNSHSPERQTITLKDRPVFNLQIRVFPEMSDREENFAILAEMQGLWQN